MSKTIQSTVRILISYDYCHFEISKTIEPDGELFQLTNSEIDDARKDCQRLADKAVGQYKTAKAEASSLTVNNKERAQLEYDVSLIRGRPQEQWTIMDKAKVKALEDYNHQARYNYMDDEDYQIN